MFKKTIDLILLNPNSLYTLIIVFMPEEETQYLEEVLPGLFKTKTK